jgi:hypothetical protein
MRQFALTASYALTLFVCLNPDVHAGGVKGKMFNLPDPQTGKVDEIKNETIRVRVTKFGTDTSIPLTDDVGKVIPPVTADGQVAFNSAAFAFNLPRSGSPDARQAVDIEFFRQGRQLRLRTQILRAVIIADDELVDNLTVSVPRPEEMGYAEPYQPCECYPATCEMFYYGRPCRRLRR